MQNFVFHNPTKIIFGRKTVPSVGAETAALGKKALLVYGQSSIKQSGLYDQVMSSLAEVGVTVIEHGGTRSNPLLDHVRAGIAKVKKEQVEVIVAVGGGSVIDTAKAIAAGAVVEHDVWKFFIGKKSIKAALPVLTVLTLAAAGSEMNSGMVITNQDTQEKFGFGHRLLFPKISILDPEVTFTVPPDYTAYGAVDAIAHVLEFYMTTQDTDTPVQARFIEGLILDAMESCDRCLADSNDYGGRANLMWTATLALNGLTAAGLGRVGFPMHMIEHSLSALYDVPHGAGLSVVMPGWLQWYLEQNAAPARITQLGRGILPPAEQQELAGESDTVIAERTIAFLRTWFSKVKSPVSLAELDIPAGDIPRIAENALGLAKVWRLKQYTQEVVEDILQRCA
ncbi:MAG: iron-containing alcohol dehydrogenase [Candidatus Electrothrix sp. GW3-4]|uniref:iron-containing alcohol dehydrogenase n=1 Tax=Candidatus Electrothrix sp. GW3-4 TaxID=3126740 RepID=UPI0030D0357D